MKTLIRFAALIWCVSAFISSSSALAQRMTTIDWQDDPQQAAARASRESKLVMLHFTADWCGPCQNQKRFVFSNPTVAYAVNESVVPVLVDLDSNRELAAELGVKTIPFDVFLTPLGDPVSKQASPKDTENFIMMVRNLPAPGVAASSVAMEEMSELRRSEDPMGLPTDQRSGFGASAPKANPFAPSREALELAEKSNYKNKLPFFRNKAKATQEKTAVTNIEASLHRLAEASEGQSSISALPNPSQTSRFFKLPEKRLDQADIASDPALNPMHPQRSHEMSQRQEFLSRTRNDMQIPRQPTGLKAKRVMNENFFASSANAKMKPSGIKGVQMSGMLDPNSGQAIEPYSAGPSVARFKVEQQPQPPAAEARIVPRQENRIADHLLAPPLAAQASMTTSARIVDDLNDKAVENVASKIDVEPSTDIAESDEEQFALQGKCPVTLVTEGTWTDGDPRWGIVHRKRTYLFSSEENYLLFQKNPDDYSPLLAGYDPVVFYDTGELVVGKEENGVFMEKNTHQQIVLFTSTENRDKFQANPQSYLRKVRQVVYTANKKADATKLK